MLGFSSVVQTDVEGLLLLGLTDKDENLASYKRDTQFTEPVLYIWKKKWLKSIPYLYNTIQYNTRQYFIYPRYVKELMELVQNI